MAMFGDDIAGEMAQAATTAERLRQNRVRSGLKGIDIAFAPFMSDSYTNSRRKEYFDANVPALMAGYRNASDQATFDDARSGQVGPGGATSSAAIARKGSLFANMNANRQGLMGQAFDFATQEKSQMQQTRANLVNLLRGVNDPSATVQAQQMMQNQYAARPPGSGDYALFANLSGIGADLAQPDWRELTKNLVLTPRASSSAPYAVVK